MANEKIAIEIFAALTNQLINQSINFNENDLVMITDINQLDLTKQYNYADYLTWKFEERLELFRGKVLKMAGATAKHQLINGKLYLRIASYLEKKTCKVFFPLLM